jgi:hypothetical protein
MPAANQLTEIAQAVDEVHVTAPAEGGATAAIVATPSGRRYLVIAPQITRSPAFPAGSVL